MEYRLLVPAEAHAAAEIHRIAGALIPGYDTTLHTPDEYRVFYAQEVLRNGPVWGAFDDGVLRGHVALRTGWIDHLYVDPVHHSRGIGSALVRLAQREQAELRLYTFQLNTRAQALYERHGFRVEELTDGQRNEEKMPDMTYHWRRQSVSSEA